VRCRPAPKLPRSNAFTLEGEGQDSIRRAYGTPRQAGAPGAESGKAYEWARLSQGGACGGRPARKRKEGPTALPHWERKRRFCARLENSFWRAGENTALQRPEFQSTGGAARHVGAARRTIARAAQHGCMSSNSGSTVAPITPSARCGTDQPRPPRLRRCASSALNRLNADAGQARQTLHGCNAWTL
jgi:hypothetical protein